MDLCKNHSRHTEKATRPLFLKKLKKMSQQKNTWPRIARMGWEVYKANCFFGVQQTGRRGNWILHNTTSHNYKWPALTATLELCGNYKSGFPSDMNEKVCGKSPNGQNLKWLLTGCAPFTTDPFTTGPFATTLVVKGSVIIIIIIIMIVIIIFGICIRLFLSISWSGVIMMVIYAEVNSETDMVAD